MKPMLAIGAALLAGYLLGSINFAVIVSRRLAGEDVRTRGSGNAGTTNMLRNYGWMAAGLTFFGDFAKGAAAVFVARALTASTDVALYGGLLGGIAALFGHMKPVFFGFRGGKGVATGLGTLLAVDPLVFVLVSVVGFPMAGVTGYVSLASISCAGAFPLVLLAVRLIGRRFDPVELVLAMVLGWTIVWNHRENIRRLKNGTERRFGHRTPKTPKEG